MKQWIWICPELGRDPLSWHVLSFPAFSRKIVFFYSLQKIKDSRFPEDYSSTAINPPFSGNCTLRGSGAGSGTGDWFIVTRKEDNTLAVETSINAGPETLTGSIVVSGEKNGDQVSATVSLVQRAERSINLSAEGTSNCYIAHTGKAYKFDASVKGNGKGDGRSDYIAAYGTGISGVAAAELLWESRNDGDTLVTAFRVSIQL